jgi:transposase-like protein
LHSLFSLFSSSYFKKKGEKTMSDQLTAYKLAKRMNISHQIVTRAIRNGFLPATRIDRTWSIAEEDAQEFVARYRKVNILANKPSDVCGSCNSHTGNIVGDIRSGERYGYLCTKCYKLLQAVEKEQERTHKVLLYIQKTRI